MHIPERYDPLFWIARFLKFSEFRKRQVRHWGYHVLGWCLLTPSLIPALEQRMWRPYIVIAAGLWYTWVDVLRFEVIRSTICPRCNRPRYESRMVLTDTKSPVRMCSACWRKHESALRSIDKISESVDQIGKFQQEQAAHQKKKWT